MLSSSQSHSVLSFDTFTMVRVSKIGSFTFSSVLRRKLIITLERAPLPYGPVRGPIWIEKIVVYINPCRQLRNMSNRAIQDRQMIDEYRMLFGNSTIVPHLDLAIFLISSDLHSIYRTKGTERICSNLRANYTGYLWDHENCGKLMTFQVQVQVSSSNSSVKLKLMCQTQTQVSSSSSSVKLKLKSS